MTKYLNVLAEFRLLRTLLLPLLSLRMFSVSGFYHFKDEMELLSITIKEYLSPTMASIICNMIRKKKEEKKREIK